MTSRRLGQVPPSDLRGARLQAHWAVQMLSAAGETFLEPTPDTSHTAMTWDVQRGAFPGRALRGRAAVLAASLRPRDADPRALVGAGNASDQEGRLRAFLASAVPASRALALESPLRSA